MQGKKEKLRAAVGTRLISNPTVQLPYPYETDSLPEENVDIQGKA